MQNRVDGFIVVSSPLYQSRFSAERCGIVHHNVLHTGVGSGLLQRSAAVRVQRGAAGDQQIFHAKGRAGGAKGIVAAVHSASG